MDRLDVRIVRELTQGQSVWPARQGLLASYRQLGRVLGVSAGTVGNRIRRMTRSGFLQGMVVYVNPSALGLSAAAYTIEVSPERSKEAVLERLGEIEGVIFFENFRGPLLGIGFMSEREEGLRETVARIDRIAAGTPGLYTRVRFPPCGFEMTGAEWKTIRCLTEGERRGFASLARELRVSVRTAKRRVARLVRAGAIFTFPRMDYHKIAGGVTAELLVTFRDPAVKAEAERRVVRQLGDRMTFAGTWEEYDMFRLILANVAEARDLSRDVAKIAGVRSVREELVDEVIDRFGALLPYLDRRISSP